MKDTQNNTITEVYNEGTIEQAVYKVYDAMKDKDRTPVVLKFFISTPWVQEQFMAYMLEYLTKKKVKKTSHVTIDIYIEEEEDKD